MLNSERFNLKSWGFENPETGMLRVQCDDSVAMGRSPLPRLRTKSHKLPRMHTHTWISLPTPRKRTN